MELVCNEIATLGEGPIWDTDSNSLWWIDIIGKKLHNFSPAGKTNQTFELPQKPGTVVIRENGKLALALHNGFYDFDPTSQSCELICDPEAEQPLTRFNDGKCDPAGRFWAGTMEDAETGLKIGGLYSLENGTATKHLSEVLISNGIVWNAAKDKMYYIDSPTFEVVSFDYDLATGAISNKQTVIQFSEDQGAPDGMSIDSDDNLWVCMWGGWGINKVDPASGKILLKVDVPACNVTACAFGGDDLTDLYITTARHNCGDLEKQPNAGGLFLTKTDVTGTTFAKFAG